MPTTAWPKPYLAIGDKEQSLAHYRRSLQLNPENYNGIDQIRRINNTYQEPEPPVTLFNRFLSAQAFKADLDAMGRKLAKVHPNAFKFITEEAFWQLIEAKKALITDFTTYGQFIWHCSEIIASVNCSHTSIGGFYQEWAMLPPLLRFPLRVRWIEDRLYVIDAGHHADQVAIKDEILRINGVQVEDLIHDIYQHIPSQGYIETSKRHDFNTWSAGMIPYALNFPPSYQVVVRGRDQPIQLSTTSAPDEAYNSPFIPPCPERLCLDPLPDEKTAVLTITSFNYYWWSALDYFQDFIDKSFEEIYDKGIENLIIDVRFNGGGSQQASIHLLRYLVKQPFIYYSRSLFDQDQGQHKPFDNRFKGTLYFLIDGNGNSTTGHFMSIVKDLGLGTIIGEELGSNQFCTAGQTICRLPNSGLEYYVANATFESSAKALPDETGILPDHYVSQHIDDFLNNVDAVMAFALALIKKANKPASGKQ